MNFQRERVHDLWPELAPIYAKHWEELAYFKEFELAPDKARYELMENMDKLRCYTVRKEGELIGYGVFVIDLGLHYATTRQSNQDVIFLLPEYRHGRVGLQFLKYIMAQLIEEGVQVDYQHVKNGHPQLGRLLEYLGYEVVDVIYGKRLGV